MEAETKQVRITWDGDKFLISCPFWANDYIHDMPGKRWVKGKRAWSIPRVRKSIEFMQERLIAPGYAEVSDEAAAAIEESMNKITAAQRESGFPSWFPYKTEPRGHQRKCLDKLYPLPAAAMFMDRGTGKSKATIDMACARRMEGKIQALLIVCKIAGRRNWADEFELHSPIGADVYLPSTDKERDFLRWLATPHDFKVMVIGIESLSAGRMGLFMEKFLLSAPSMMMVVDESHLIANPQAERTVKVIAARTRTAYRVALTGTPISTGPLNLFSQFEFLDPDIIGIGDYYSFKNRYAVMGGYRNDKGKPMQIIGYQNLDELTSAVAPYVYECRKKDVLDLPPKVYKKAYIQMTSEQRAIYDQVRKEEEYSYKGKTVTAKTVLETMLRLHQIAGGFVSTGDEIERPDGRMKKVYTAHAIMPWKKNPKVTELLDICSDDKQTITWCAYRPEIASVVEALQDTYPKDLVREIHGGISESDRHVFMKEYQSGKCKHLVGNTVTGGTSLTLTACETMIYYNNTEKLIDREQSEDRAHRDGLKHSVLYIDLIAEKTVDETIIKSLQMKMDLSEYVRRHIADASRLMGGG